MNIFATSDCPNACAIYLDDKRLGKMLLESCQMLCTVARMHGIDAPYRSTHSSHPCTKWVAASRQNWEWLWLHGVALANEWRYRRGKVHACVAVLNQLPPSFSLLPSLGRTPFAKVVPAQFQGLEVHEAYRQTLQFKWHKAA